MSLPIPLAYEPMNALLVPRIPSGGGWQYEPKWDGFRCLAHRDGDEIELMSKSGQPLGRYFPEVVAALAAVPTRRFVLDGEIVVPTTGGALSFDALLQRIHPAASRVRKLSVETPGLFLLFDILVDERGKSLVDRPLEERRSALEAFYKKHGKKNERLTLSPATTSEAVARKWFEGVGAALDGIIAKRLGIPYETGTRDGMVKVKKMRTADCVVGGIRYGSKGNHLGSLLLGLYDDEGLLNHVGFCSAFPEKTRGVLMKAVEPLIGGEGFTGNKPGGPSRWSTERSTEWTPLKPTLVVEVRYDHFSNGRFRHGTKFMRLRPDKTPGQCTMKQLDREAASLSLMIG